DVFVELVHAGSIGSPRWVRPAQKLPARTCDLKGVLLVIEGVMHIANHLPSELICPAMNGLLFGRSGPDRAADHQGRAGFVDEDVVGLIDQHEVMPALHPGIGWPCESAGQP